MTAFESRLALASKQTGEAAADILDWLGSEGTLVGAERVALLHEFYRAESTARKLAVAVTRPPSVALVGPARVGKSHLAASLIEGSGQPLAIQFDGIREDIPYLKHIAPDSVRHGTAAITRLSQRSRALQQQCPVGLRLLSLADVIRILTMVWLGTDESRAASLPTAEALRALTEKHKTRDEKSTFGGLGEEDIWDLRDTLNARHGDDRLIKALNTIGYWEAVAEMSPHLGNTARAEILGLLWGDQPLLTAAFITLSDALQSLGFGRTASSALDGIVALDPRTGRFQRRTDSIMSAGTLGTLSAEGDQTVVVQSETAQWVSIARPVLTAITAEVRLPLKGVMSEILDRGDVLELPAIDAPEVVSSLASSAASDPSLLGRVFMRAKAIVLMDRAIDELDMTAVVVCTPMGSRRMGDLAPLLTRWVARSQGQDPAQRESRDCSLFVAFTKFDREIAEQTKRGRDKLKNWDDAIAVPLLDGLGHVSDWPREWTPLRAFDQVHIVRAPNAKSRALLEYGHDGKESAIKPQHAERIEAARRAFLESEAVRKHVAEPEAAWREALELNDGGVSYLADSIARVVDSRVKQRQITAELFHLRHSMRDRLTRYVASDHPALQLDQRHNTALMVLRRLRRTAEAHRLGHLLKSLQMAGPDIAAVIAALESEAKGAEIADFAPVNGKPRKTPRASLDADRAARRILMHWIENLRALPNASDIDELFRLPRNALVHLVDELVIAARRLELEGRVAERIRQLQSDKATDQERLSRAALAASTALNDFIVTLGFDSTQSNMHPRRRGHGQRPIFEKRQVIDLNALPDQSAPFDQEFYSDWSEAFLALVHANGQALKDQAGKQKDAPRLTELIKRLDAPL
ncbi:MAG: hypothetical protein RL291_1834 [Pseudomonadota bacterium]